MAGKKSFNSKSPCQNIRSLRHVANGRVMAKRLKNNHLADTEKFQHLDTECDALGEFVRTGRTGRRNALPMTTSDKGSLTRDPSCRVSVSDLPDSLAKMSCANEKVSNSAPLSKTTSNASNNSQTADCNQQTTNPFCPKPYSNLAAPKPDLPPSLVAKSKDTGADFSEDEL